MMQEKNQQSIQSEAMLRGVAEMLRTELSGLLGVYLFGSMAAGEARGDSDIDLAVLTHQAVPPVELWELAQKAALLAGRDVDLVDLHSASSVMRMQIVAHGRRLACFDVWQCESFEDFVYADYARLNEERAAILEDVGRQGLVYG